MNQTLTQIEEAEKEKILETFLRKMVENVFVKSTNSVTGKIDELRHGVHDMEAIITLMGQWDREDLKNILFSLSTLIEQK